MRLFFIALCFGALAACGSETVYEGELRVSSAADLSILDGIQVVEGDLQITAEDISELNIGDLTRVEGDLWIRYNTRLTDLNMPNLSSVSGGLSISQNERLDTIDLTALRSVGGSFAISYNCKLPSFRADAIAEQVSIGCSGVNAAGICVNTSPNFGDEGC